MGAASAAALAATGCATTGAAGTAEANNNSITGPNLNLLESAEDNMTAYARLQGNLDSSKTKYGWYKGMVSAVMPGKVVKDLFMMEGFFLCAPAAQVRRPRLPQSAARSGLLPRTALRPFRQNHGGVSQPSEQGNRQSGADCQRSLQL